MKINKAYKFRMYPDKKQEEIILPKFIPNKIIGMGLGIKDLVITSDYKKYKNKRK
ncbi:MAG: helix-turn-helix domain-containing protein [Bacilli bacterium]|nr:helix-turn-helix domain-containing protein [Bacilli bacterium]